MLGIRHFTQAGQSAEIVHALKDNHVANTGLRKHIAIEARQRIRPQSICQKMVATDALVQHSYVVRCGGAL